MDNFIFILQIIGFIITALSAAVRFVKWVREGREKNSRN